MPSTGLIVLSNPDYKGEVFFEEGSANTAEMRKALPNKIVVKLHIEHPQRLIVNMNFDKNWFSSAGKVCNYNNLLAVERLNKGDYELCLTYRPILFYVGCFLSLISVILSWWFFFRKKEGR